MSLIQKPNIWKLEVGVEDVLVGSRSGRMRSDEVKSIHKRPNKFITFYFFFFNEPWRGIIIPITTYASGALGAL